MNTHWLGYILLFFSLFALAILIQRRRTRKSKT
jgi:hypothetical protein